MLISYCKPNLLQNKHILFWEIQRITVSAFLVLPFLQLLFKYNALRYLRISSQIYGYLSLTQTCKTSIKQCPSLPQQQQNPLLHPNTVRGNSEGLFSGGCWTEPDCGHVPGAIQCHRPRGYVLPQVCSEGSATTLQWFCPKRATSFL